MFNADVKTKKLTDKNLLREQLVKTVHQTPVFDIHTHLFPPQFGEFNLFGIDELLIYHYLVAEMFRVVKIKPERFWNLSKKEQANLVWQSLFIENTPISEAALGVITVLSELGIDPNTKNLDEIRDFFRLQKVSEHINRVFKIANVSEVVMTNDPFDKIEAEIWGKDEIFDQRFRAALRTDKLLNNWEKTAEENSFDKDIGEKTIAKIRDFFDLWIVKMKPLYMAVSLPDDFDYFADDERNLIIREIVLPIAREHKMPFALMIGVRRNVNPALRSAGDGLGKADIKSLEKICAENADVRFLATFLSRENQHELCVAARKFGNLMPFGCWWFLNNPSVISEITKERLELLGTSFIPQHSDSRVLEQLIYKWKHSRCVIADALYESYERLLPTGRNISESEIKRDVEKLFSGNFCEFVGINGK